MVAVYKNQVLFFWEKYVFYNKINIQKIQHEINTNLWLDWIAMSDHTIIPIVAEMTVWMDMDNLSDIYTWVGQQPAYQHHQAYFVAWYPHYLNN